jgi:anti-sigma factor ChrR (cupin superfamily)
MIDRLLQQLASWFSGHPTEERLLSYHHDELKMKLHERILRHLGICPRCRRRVEQIAEEWRILAEMTSKMDFSPDVGEEELITRIQESIQQWSSEMHPSEEPLSQSMNITRLKSR